MKRTLNAFAIAVTATLFAAVPIFARQPATPPPTTSYRHSSRTATVASDQTFAKEAARSNAAEVKLGQLAEQKGTNDTVKDFGKRMVDDHSKANEQLESTATPANITLPSQPSRMEQEQYIQLSKLRGTAFDKAYARDMLKDHEQDIAAFQREAKYGKNQDIKNWASLTLPTLEEHLKLARQMYHSVESDRTGTSGGSSESKP